MATPAVMRSASEYDPAATKSIKRTLNLYASELDYELPPAVKVKTADPQAEISRPNVVEIAPVKDVESPRVGVSAIEGLAPFQPDYGHRIIADLIDQRAREDPQRPFWSLPRSSNLADGFRDIGYGSVARAINRTAWWLEEIVGKSTTFETLAYMGPPDLRYAVLTVAAQKTGHTVSRTSPARELYLCFQGFLLFIVEQHRSAPAPS